MLDADGMRFPNDPAFIRHLSGKDIPMLYKRRGAGFERKYPFKTSFPF